MRFRELFILLELYYIMAKVDSSYFGSIIIDGNKFDHDVIVDANGLVRQRDSSHEFTKRNVEDLLLLDPEVIVIGTGTAGLMKVHPDVEVAAQMNGVEIVAKKTPDAVKEFNKYSKRKRTIGVFHLTC
jgi:hypothetical protein